MNAVSTPSVHPPVASSPLARWRITYRTAAALGILWNLFGLYQFATSLGASADSLMAQGMRAAQAQLYLGLPAWMNLVFGIGVIGGLLGSLALAARRRAAVAMFAVSLAGYTVLFAGDAYFGLFAAIPGQFAILSVVLLIAVALSAIARHARRTGWLH